MLNIVWYGGEHRQQNHLPHSIFEIPAQFCSAAALHGGGGVSRMEMHNTFLLSPAV